MTAECIICIISRWEQGLECGHCGCGQSLLHQAFPLSALARSPWHILQCSLYLFLRSCFPSGNSIFAQYCGGGSLTERLPISEACRAPVTHDLRIAMAYSNKRFPAMLRVHFFSDPLFPLQHLAKSSWGKNQSLLFRWESSVFRELSGSHRCLYGLQ